MTIVRQTVVDLLADEDDAVLHQAREQVEAHHADAGLLFVHGDIFHHIQRAVAQVGREHHQTLRGRPGVRGGFSWEGA